MSERGGEESKAKKFGKAAALTAALVAGGAAGADKIADNSAQEAITSANKEKAAAIAESMQRFHNQGQDVQVFDGEMSVEPSRKELFTSPSLDSDKVDLATLGVTDAPNQYIDVQGAVQVDGADGVQFGYAEVNGQQVFFPIEDTFENADNGSGVGEGKFIPVTTVEQEQVGSDVTAGPDDYQAPVYAAQGEDAEGNTWRVAYGEVKEWPAAN